MAWFDDNAPQASEGLQNTGVTGGLPTGNGSGVQPDLATFKRDYWAPDREQVLAQMRGPGGNAASTGGGTGGVAGYTGSAPQFTSGMSPDQVRAAVEQFYASRGVKPFPTSVDSWVNYYNQWGSKDPAYFQQRLNIADEFGGGGGSAGSFGGGTGGYGGLIAPFGAYKTPDPFQAPSVTDENAPGYQWAKQQGMQGIERSAAARGSLLSGGTLKALNAYNTGLANQTYGDVFNRALAGYTTNANVGLGGYNANKDTFFGNQNNAWSKLYQAMGIGQNSSTAGATGA